MADFISKGNLFDPELVSDLINKVRGQSALAVLAAKNPIPFVGQKEFIFTMDSEVDIVAENGKKTHGGITLEPVQMIPIKVEYGARVSDEFLYASEEQQIDVLKAFNDGFAAKVARGIDLMAFHGLNPRTGQASTVIGQNHFDAKVTQTVEYQKEDPEAGLVAAISMVEGADNDVTGLAMSPAFRTDIGQYRVNGVRQYPAFGVAVNPKDLNGLPVAVNRTVYTATSKDQAIIGDFANAFKWGYAKQIPLEIIRYGDPDNSGKDLKGYNQVYLRSEAYLGWGILDPKAFARILSRE